MCYQILNDPVMELNPITFDTLVIQYVEAIHVTKSCFVLAFCQISLHPRVSGLYNFSPEVERASRSKKPLYASLSKLWSRRFFTAIWWNFIGWGSETIIKRNFAKISDDSCHLSIYIFPSLSFAMPYLRKHRSAHTMRITVQFFMIHAPDAMLENNSTLRRMRRATGNNEIRRMEMEYLVERPWRKIRDLREEIVVYPVISSKRTFISLPVRLSR